MKRLFLWIFLLSFYLNSFALNESCFEYIWTTDVPQNEIFLLNTNKKIDYAKTESSPIYFKLYNEENKNVEYDVPSIKIDQKVSMVDNFPWTYYEFALWKDKPSSLTFDFKEIVWPWINWKIDIETKLYYYTISISKDNVNYENISLNNLDTFSFRYFKINFTSAVDVIDIAENIKIKDIIFTKKIFSYLVNWNTWNSAKFYTNFYCSNDKDYKDLEKYNNDNLKAQDNFVYKTWMKTLDIQILKNISYYLDQWSDIDWDWVKDSEDNCKQDFNPTQKDTNTNRIWDLCDDDDNDGFLGKHDNCPYNYNPNQLDVNNNKIWDVCEFDKDKDWIYDSVDNCINIVNSDQKDDDQDNIWDACDNCKLYNPTQIDKNNNEIWDKCEETEKFETENDKDKDGIIDYIDNCKEISNNKQEDSDLDSIWDVCDNCKYIRNASQEDENKNNIWDLCEDSDNDWILWYLDNCINNSNADQKDSDNNSIWDMCEDYDNDSILTFNDNCPYDYNTDQKDIDKDGKWDICDDKDNRFIESNKAFFIWFIIFVVIGFFAGIFVMFRKLHFVKK